MNDWYCRCCTGVVLPSPGKREDAATPTEEWWENHFGVQPHCWRSIRVFPELSGGHPLGLLESFSHPAMLGGELQDFGENQQMRAAAPPSWGVPHPSSSSTGPLPEANLFPVKHILERVHPKMSNETNDNPAPWAFLLQPRAASSGHFRPPSGVPSSFLPSPAPYISDLITCETQGRGVLKLSHYKTEIYRNMRSLAGFYDVHGAIPCPKPICYISTLGLFVIPDTPPSVPHHAVAGALVSRDSKDEITSSQ